MEKHFFREMTIAFTDCKDARGSQWEYKKQGRNFMSQTERLCVLSVFFFFFFYSKMKSGRVKMHGD